MLLKKILFEAPIDAWAAKYGTNLKQQAEPLINDFQKSYANIFLPDVTKYNLKDLKTIIDIVKLAKQKGLKSDSIKWLTKQFYLNRELTIQNITEDYIPLLVTVFKNKNNFKPIEEYKNIIELNNAIQDQQSETLVQQSTDEQKDIFFHLNGWSIAMPHTTEASCELGSGTTWCTARTDSQNLFLSYAGRANENIVLFYVIKDNANSRKNPTDKMSIGFIDGKPVFNGKHGGVSVDASNNGLTIEKFKSILGDELAELFIQKMSERVEQIKGMHPAKEEFKKIAKNYNLFLQKINSFKDKNAAFDFIKVLVNYDTDPKIYDWLYEKYKDDTSMEGSEFTADLLTKPKIPENILLKASEVLAVRGEKTFPYINIVYNPNTPAKALENAVVGGNLDQSDLIFVVKHPNVTSSILDEIYNINEIYNYDSIEDLIIQIAISPKISDNLLNVLFKKRPRLILMNPRIPLNYLIDAVKGKDWYNRSIALSNPSLPVEYMYQFSEDANFNIKMSLARNPKLPLELIEEFSESYNDQVREEIAKNIATPSNILSNLSLDDEYSVRWGVAENPNTPIEILRILKNDDVFDVAVEARNRLKALNEPLNESVVLSYLIFNN